MLRTQFVARSLWWKLFAAFSNYIIKSFNNLWRYSQIIKGAMSEIVGEALKNEIQPKRANPADEIQTKHIELAERFRTHISTDNRFERIDEVQQGNLYFRLKTGRRNVCEEDMVNCELLKRINQSGKVFMKPMAFDRKFTIRFSVNGEHASNDDVGKKNDDICLNFRILIRLICCRCYLGNHTAFGSKYAPGLQKRSVRISTGCVEWPRWRNARVLTTQICSVRICAFRFARSLGK